MKNLGFICIGFLLMFASCGQNSAEYKTLTAQNDSLKLVNARNNAELDELISIMNDVEDNFRNIKEAENYLSVQSATGGEMTPSTKNRIANDMRLITETLQRNKEQISELEKKLNNSSVQSLQLKKTVQRLQSELNEKTNSLVSLQSLLAQKDNQIAELSESVASLSSDVQTLQTQTQEQQQLIKQQDATIKSAYYCFGTSKELKEQKILVKGQLGTNFNKDYFTLIKDINNFSEIPLFAKKAKLITKHPAGSFEMVKESSGNLIFKITNPQNFWSIEKYLVIEVS